MRFNTPEEIMEFIFRQWKNRKEGQVFCSIWKTQRNLQYGRFDCFEYKIYYSHSFQDVCHYVMESVEKGVVFSTIPITPYRIGVNYPGSVTPQIYTKEDADIYSDDNDDGITWVTEIFFA